MPPETNQFDRATITDLVMHVRYTARDGGAVLRTAALESLAELEKGGGVRLFSARHEMAAEWKRFFSPSQGEYTLTLPFNEARFPFKSGKRDRQITGVMLALKLAENVQIPETVPGFTGALKRESSNIALEWKPNTTVAGLLTAAPKLGNAVAPGTFSVVLTQADINTAPEAWTVTVDGTKRLNPDVVRDLLILATFTTPDAGSNQ